MLTVKELKPDVWELVLEGIIDKHDIETMARALTPALMGDRQLGLIVRAEGLSDMTADAMAEDAKFEFGLLPQWSRVSKMALVTDLQAFAALLNWINPILPMIDMKSFGAADVAAAEAFASDLPREQAREEDRGSAAGVTQLPEGTGNLLAFEISGRITPEDVDRILVPLKARIEANDTFNLLIRLRNYDGFDPTILANGTLMATKMAAVSHLGRYALIGAPKWMKAMIDIVRPLVPFEMQMFDTDEDDAAWDWVRAA